MNDLYEYNTTTGTGWVCPVCDTYVAHGQTHVCPGKEQEELKYKISFSSDGADLATAINNMARAIQNLADVLEKIDE